MFNRAIQDALTKVKCVIVLWTKTSAQSKWVEAEAYWAWEDEKLASVILDEGLRLPLPFNTTHAENLSDWSGDSSAPHFVKLIDDLTAIAGIPLAIDLEESLEDACEAEGREIEEFLDEFREEPRDEVTIEKDLLRKKDLFESFVRIGTEYVDAVTKFRGGEISEDQVRNLWVKRRAAFKEYRECADHL